MKKLLLITLLSLGILGCNNKDNKLKSISKEEILSHATEYNLKDTTKNKINGLVTNINEIKFIDDLTSCCEINRFDFLVLYFNETIDVNVQGQSLILDKHKAIQSINYLISELRVKEYKFYKYKILPDNETNIFLIEGYSNDEIITNLIFYIKQDDFKITQIDII